MNGLGILKKKYQNYFDIRLLPAIKPIKKILVNKNLNIDEIYSSSDFLLKKDRKTL